MSDQKYIEIRNNNGYEYVTRLIGTRGAVVIIAKDEEDRYQLILSKRPTFDKPILEFPAGLIDHEDESLEEVAIRELREETGWDMSGGVFGLIVHDMYPSPSSGGLSDEILYFAVANLKFAKKFDPDHQDGEKITVLPLMNEDELCSYISSNKDTIHVSSRVLAFALGKAF
jgi:8-oxo-dGTP pyrophosphatase MutT (NUDIX family)